MRIVCVVSLSPPFIALTSAVLMSSRIIRPPSQFTGKDQS
jgi:hypothetical protein